MLRNMLCAGARLHTLLKTRIALASRKENKEICSIIIFVFLFVQIENEYGPESKEFGPAGQSYVNWAAQMAVGLGTGVPWVMCKEDDAPDPVV